MRASPPGPMTRGRLPIRLALVAAAALALLWSARCGRQRVPAVDRLAELDYSVTSGAAPGYVEDRACALCHSEIWTSYREVGMARSFSRPRREEVVEELDRTFLHERSKQRFRMTWRDGRLVFQSFQVAADGLPIHELELEVDWIVGSGHTSRVYLYRTPGGELFQLPIAWYAQGSSWGMAPGFDRPDHPGVGRRVRRECMFCHNAYPDVPAASDSYGAPQLFPAELPEGTGCQRCHGPGAEHAERALDPRASPEATREAIVNPGRLPPRLRDDVCFECHLQPSVAIPGIRRFDRADYSFRPGEPLSGYLIQVDVEEEGRRRGERFEINHHAYRLLQSRCYLASAGALSCLTCHDPHRKVPPAQRPAHYRAACLGCHQPEDCGDPAATHASAAADADCVACHMPRRRTEDVVRVVMTDHRIGRHALGPQLLAPLEEREPVIVGIEPLAPEAPTGPPAELHRTLAAVRAGAGGATGDRLARLLAEASPPEPVPFLDLAQRRLHQRRFAEALAALEEVRARAPGLALADEWRAIAEAGEGRLELAESILREVLARDPRRAESWLNLGFVRLGLDRPAEALVALERAVELRPTAAAGWLRIGEAHAALDRPREAAAALRRSLALDPRSGGAYAAIAAALVAAGEPAAARRYLEHGRRHAARPEAVEAAAAALGFD